MENLNELLEGKTVLDATCGSRMMWFDKKDPDTVYADVRTVDTVMKNGRTLKVKPDIVVDFRAMPFPSDYFNLIVFDPPHLRDLGKTSYMGQKYGVLTYHWRHDIKEGLVECMRVLKPGGTMIFKWNEHEIKIQEILKLVPEMPMFGHTNGKRGFTVWMTFYKRPTIK